MDDSVDFVCEDHKPQREPGQRWLQNELPCKCDHCDKPASFAVVGTTEEQSA